MKSPLFHIRPLFIAALGLCFGTGLFVLYSDAAHNALLLFLLGCSLLFLLLGRKPAFLFVLCLAIGLARSRVAPLSIPNTVTTFFSDLSDSVGSQIDRLFPIPPGAARGMLLGARNTEMDKAFSERLYDVGVGHLLAVSGLHVSTIAGAITLVWRRSRLCLRYLVLVLFLLFYTLLTGGAPSVIRASVMLLVATPMGLSLQRRDPLSSLALACCIVVLLDPTAPTTVGFQLSFLAVLGLQLMSAPLQRRFSFFGSPISTALSASIAATVGTLPIMCRAFSEVSVFGIFANLLIVPLAAFFLVPAFVCTMLSFPFPVFAECLAAVPRFVLDVMMTLATAGGSTVLRIGAPSVPSMLLYYAALFLYSRYCLRSRNLRLLYGTAALLAAILLW